MRYRSLVNLVVGGLLLVPAAAACSNNSDDPAAFCEAVRANEEALTGPVVTPEQVPGALEAFRSVGRLTPAQIDGEWDRVTDLLERAATAAPGDGDARREVTDLALARRRDADAVVAYVAERCNVALGPLTATAAVPTTVPSGTAGPASSTSAPSRTTTTG